MRIIARFEKGEAVRFVSHLDIQRTFQRAFRRANVPLAYSQGFNPHPQLSFATALSLGYTSEAEWFDVKLAEQVQPEAFRTAVNAVLPAGFFLAETMEAQDGLPALTALMAASEYEIRLYPQDETEENALEEAFKALASQPIMVEKRTKGGIKTVDLSPMLLKYRFGRSADHALTLTVLGVADAKGSLNIDLLLGALMKVFPLPFSYRVHRKAIYSANGLVMPALPQEI